MITKLNQFKTKLNETKLNEETDYNKKYIDDNKLLPLKEMGYESKEDMITYKLVK